MIGPGRQWGEARDWLRSTLRVLGSRTARRNPIAVKRMVKISAVRSARTVASLEIRLISTRSAEVSGWELTSRPPNSTADAWALTSRLTAARSTGLMAALDLTPPERPPAIDRSKYICSSAI